MSQIQNQSLHSIIQPLLFLGGSFLAGRAIQYFPGGNPKALLMQGALASTCAFGSTYLASDNETRIQSWMRSLASIAVATLATPLIGKALSGRVEVSMGAALRLAAAQSLIGVGVAFFCSDLLATYNTYKGDKEAWGKLKEAERTEYAKLFYEGDLAPFATLDEGSYKTDIFSRKDFDKMSAGQLQWHVAVIPHIEEFSNEDLINLNKALHAKELPLEFLNRFESRAFFDVILNEHKELMGAYLLQYPFFACFCQFEGLDVWESCKDNVDVSRRQIEESQAKKAEKYSANEWLQFTPVELRFIVNCCQQCDKPTPALYFLTRAGTGIDPQAWINPTTITPECVAYMKESDAAFNWFINEYRDFPIAFATIAPEVQAELIYLIAEKGLDLIESAHSYLARVDIANLSANEAYDLSMYFNTNADAWRELSPQKRSEYFNCFIENRLYLPTFANIQLDLDTLRFQRNSIPVGNGCAERVKALFEIAQAHASSAHPVVDAIHEDIHQHFSLFSLNFELIDTELKEALVKHSPLYKQDPIREPSDYIASVEQIIDDAYHADRWLHVLSAHRYFLEKPEEWKAQTPEHIADFINRFTAQGFSLPPLDEVDVSIERLNLNPRVIDVRNDAQYRDQDIRNRKQQIENLLNLDQVFEGVHLPNKENLQEDHRTIMELSNARMF